MSRAYCECPNCGGQITVTWGFDTLKAACLRDEDGDVVTDSDCLDATRVTYLHHVRCPHCGMRLRVEHELAPTFYAREEACDAD
jgi:DNA-directed RNA polymerase subunit RPC12/RpoP